MSTSTPTQTRAKIELSRELDYRGKESAKARVKYWAEQASHYVRNTSERAQASAKELSHKAEAYVQDQPMGVLIGAAVVGGLLGIWSKRR